ncbi:proline--tRNA ligase [Granulicella cerasi]|uniref:Proline--tRNA ligase n=1 Tax=Granulicella cerasi TaxID=741063 RepID=A0ABW1Z5V2_9BACT|nr:proline--tRNA ligase [Granulicella cerasi]
MQRWSKLFIPTLREAPADAEVASHKLLLRAGYVRQLGAGIYSYLPLGQRSINKIIAIVREEMDQIAQEFFLPALNPAEVWQESGRWTGMGDNMFRLKDRKGAELCLAMTHEEIMTSIARNELRSYKQLPQIWYQIQTKFRDEPRPKSGLLRVRQFTMKDAYSFDIDQAGLDISYDKHDAAYRTIFTRCGLEFVAVEADSGSMGGSQSQEFMVYTEAGEDLIASSTSGYAANLEKATSKLAPVEDLAATAEAPEEVHTPGFRTIEEVGNFLRTQPHHQIKTMAYIVEHPESDAKQIKTVGKTRAVVAFLRGDHTLNETKLGAIALGEVRPMTPEEIAEVFKAPAGYLGPIGLEAAPHPRKPGVLVVLDASLEGRTNLIAGANKEEYHLRNVTPGRDFKPTVIADVRNINEGELDPIGGQPLRLGKAVEIGHIFKLGYKYSEAMGARVLDANGKEVTPIMGSYGIGIERILTAAIESSAAKFAEQTKDDPKATEQYALPAAIAPFEVVVSVTNVREADLAEAGEKLASELDALRIDVLLDDRDERAGVKFKDAELIGVPFRINIGKKLAEGLVEVVDRLTGTTADVAIDGAAQYVQTLVATAKK